MFIFTSENSYAVICNKDLLVAKSIDTLKNSYKIYKLFWNFEYSIFSIIEYSIFIPNINSILDIIRKLSLISLIRLIALRLQDNMCAVIGQAT